MKEAELNIAGMSESRILEAVQKLKLLHVELFDPCLSRVLADPWGVGPNGQGSPAPLWRVLNPCNYDSTCMRNIQMSQH